MPKYPRIVITSDPCPNCGEPLRTVTDWVDNWESPALPAPQTSTFAGSTEVTRTVCPNGDYVHKEARGDQP